MGKLIPTLPARGTATAMHHRHHHDTGRIHLKIHAKGKTTHQSTSCTFMDNGKDQRRFRNRGKDRLGFIQKLVAQASILFFIPKRGIFQIKLGFLAKMMAHLSSDRLNASLTQQSARR